MIVNSQNEWDQLKSIVVGTAENLHYPNSDKVFALCDTLGTWEKSSQWRGYIPEHVRAEAEEDLQGLVDVLEKLSVTVHRPKALEFSKITVGYDWIADGFNAYNPRDSLLVVGDTVIECPMAMRSRQQEVLCYDHIRREAICDGTRWISAPKPRLLDAEIFVKDKTLHIPQDEPIFDAANVLRLGKDLLYLVSNTGNELGGRWLQNVLGKNYTVHFCHNLYAFAHIDSTITALNEEQFIVNASRVNDTNLPPVLQDKEIIYVTEDMIEPQTFWHYPYASAWIAMNMLSVNPSTVVIEHTQTKLMDLLSSKGFDVVPVSFRHARTLGGGLHCATLDLERIGK